MGKSNCVRLSHDTSGTAGHLAAWKHFTDTSFKKTGHVSYPYFAMYNVHFFVQIFEGKIRVHIVHGYNDYIPWVQ